MRFLVSLLAVLVSLSTASVGSAATIDEALKLFKSRDYGDAAFALYDVMQTDSSPDNRDQAEIYLAETLYKMELYVPALFYYTDIFKVGRANRYYLTAVEGLLKVQQAMHDPIWVPSLINEYLDPEGFEQLEPAKIAQVNYMVGELSYRSGKMDDARVFLEAVLPESMHYPKARYIQGLIEYRAKNSEQALVHFGAAVDAIPDDTSADELRRVRGLAQVALGRALYGETRYAEASAAYEKVPRFSTYWFTSMYENAWSYYKQGDYGRSLGELHTVTSPYFDAYHVPEAYVIQGITYFVNCQWDRVRRAVTLYKNNYEPMLSGLSAYLAQKREPADYYRNALGGTVEGLELELIREIRRTKKFRDYHFMLEHIDWQSKRADKVRPWTDTRLGNDVKAIIDQQGEQLESLVGSWVRQRLRNREGMLKNFQNQINILDFEVANSEADWLEQGREILKGRRRRLPRPAIESDQWQHWGFDKEYWKGELGYYHHSLRSECD